MSFSVLFSGKNLGDSWLCFRKSSRHGLFTRKFLPFYVLTSTIIENACSHKYAVMNDERTTPVNLVIRGYPSIRYSTKTYEDLLCSRHSFESRLPEVQCCHLCDCCYLHL